jgi:DUF917 family protein
MKLDLATRICALFAGAALVGCGGGGTMSAGNAATTEAAAAAAAESAKEAAAMAAITPVPRECATE